MGDGGTYPREDGGTGRTIGTELASDEPGGQAQEGGVGTMSEG